MARRRFSRDVDSAITRASQLYGIDPNVMRGIAAIESGGNPREQTGSYSGLFQLNAKEFKRGGGNRDVFDPVDNSMAAARLFRGYQAQFEKSFGREASPSELYMIHQQGWGGFNAHMKNPDAPAWQNMASTAEGRARGSEWAQRAILGNTLPEYKKKYGAGITSGQFMNMWAERLGREGIQPTQPTRFAQATPPVQPTIGQTTPDQDMAQAQAEPPITAPRTEQRTQLAAAQPQPQPQQQPPVAQAAPADGNAFKAGFDSISQDGKITLGSLFGIGGGSSGTGLLGLKKGGGAAANISIKVPEFQDPASQMAQFDQGDQWPAIQAPPQRRYPRRVA